MRRRAWLAMAALSILPAFTMAASGAEEPKAPSVKTPLQVTYYFLPG